MISGQPAVDEIRDNFYAKDKFIEGNLVVRDSEIKGNYSHNNFFSE